MRTGHWKGKQIPEEIKLKMRGKRRPLSEEHKQKLRGRTGEKSHLWRGGTTPEHTLRFYTPEWREVSKRIRERDGFRCQKCGGKGWEVHHKIPFRIGGENTEDNLITLCGRCHRIQEALLLPEMRNNLGQFKKIIFRAGTEQKEG